MPDCCDGRSIPVDHHAFQRLIRSVLQENPHFDRVQVKRKIVRLCGLPGMGNSFWYFQEPSFRGAMRTRKELFDDRFALAWKRVHNKR